MKIHNGGAVSALCSYLDNSNYDDYSDNSGYPITDPKIKADNAQITFTLMTDYSNITIDKYKLRIQNSFFIENYSGMKGSALYIKQYSNVIILNC